MDKTSIFKHELSKINDESIREWTQKAIESLPDYIFTIPASSTGKYHPDYALGEGGLVRHIKAAVRIALELFNIYGLTDSEKDIIIAALLLHDGATHGLTHERYFKHEHPIIICEWLKSQDFFTGIPQAQDILDGIASHMGQWNTNNYSSVVLPLPVTKIQKFIHLCDYLASKKCLELNFDVG